MLLSLFDVIAKEEYILFEPGVEEALATEYDAGTPQYRRWSAGRT